MVALGDGRELGQEVGPRRRKVLVLGLILRDIIHLDLRSRQAPCTHHTGLCAFVRLPSSKLRRERAPLVWFVRPMHGLSPVCTH